MREIRLAASTIIAVVSLVATNANHADLGFSFITASLAAGAAYVLGIFVQEIVDTPNRISHEASLPEYWAQYGLPPRP